MPDRMIREGIKTSLAINQLDDSAETFFIRLLLTTDKNGTYHAEPELLRAAIYPLKTTLRLTEVLRRRDACVRAGLLRLWVASDGRSYVQAPKFRQRVPHERPKFPIPPGDPDETGQESLGLTDPSPPPIEVKESKGRGDKRARASTRTAAPPPVAQDEDQAQAIARLRALFPRIDLDAELDKATANRRKAGKLPLDLIWFERHWLPKCGATYRPPQPANPAPACLVPNTAAPVENIFSRLAAPSFAAAIAEAQQEQA